MSDCPLSRPGRHGGDGGALRTCVERVCVLAGDFGADSCAQSRGDLTSTAKSLLLCFEAGAGPDPWEPRDAHHHSSSEGRGPPGTSRTGPDPGRGDPERIHALPSRPPRGSGERAPRGTQWV